MHTNKLTILLVGGHEPAVTRIQEMLQEAVSGELRVVYAESSYQVPGALAKEGFNAVLLLLPETDGIAEAVETLTDCASLPVVVLAPSSNDAAAEALVRQGAESRLRMDTATPLLLKSALRHAIEKRGLRTQLRGMESQLYHAQKMEGLGLLAGGIAHDFNNLLVAILGQADMALTDLADSSRVQKCLDAIKRASIRASDLTAQMLAYAGKSSPELAPRNLNRLIEEISRLLSSSIPRKVKLEMDLAENLPAVEMDVTQIRQVVLNLITNAGEAIGNKPGCIRVSTALSKTDPCGEAAQSGGRTWVQLQVADDGCGMSRKTIEKIFEPFFSTKYSGRGLGMSAVQGIVRRHGGNLSVQSTPGEGTTFRLALPASSREVAEPAEPPQQEVRAFNKTCRSILVVDDEEDVRDILTAMLESSGFVVITAPDGPSGLEVLREQGEDIAAVILDMTMPVMSGDEVLTDIRRMLPEMPVLLCSGYEERQAMQMVGAGDISGFIAKPFQLKPLVNAVVRAVEQAARSPLAEQS